MYSIGIDIGGTNTDMGLVRNDGTIIARSNIPTNAYTELQPYIHDIMDCIAKLMKDNNVEKIEGIGIGAPNGNFYTGCVDNAPNLTIKGVLNFEQEMHKYGEFDNEYNHFLPGASYEAAKHGFAAGCSEHSTGLAFDITDESVYWADMNYSNVHDETVAGTPVCKWMDEHCAEYGFIVRYPADKAEVYGMACYPGHYRYVGREAAKYIMDNHLCLEEFLALYGKTFRGVNYVNEYTVRAQ